MQIFHSNSFIVPVTGSPVEGGAVVVRGGVIHDLGRYADMAARYPDIPHSGIHHTDHIIMPSLVNAHTHLEYADVDIPPLSDGESFFDWITKLNKTSRNWDSERLAANINKSLGILSSGGVGLIGDSGFSGLATDILADYPMRSLYFQEYFGLSKDIALTDKLSGLNKKYHAARGLPELPHNYAHQLGISPHSLYTANTTLWSKLADHYPEMRFSSHIAESRDEAAFFWDGHNSNIEKFYNFVLPHLQYEHPYRVGATPYQVLEEAGILDRLDDRLLSVHNIQVTDEDIVLAARHHISLCLCPLSNKYLGNGAPPVDKLHKAGLNLTLGTDSLASNHGLDMFAEMGEIAAISNVPAEYIIKMATINGAKALGYNSITGSLEIGKSFDAIELAVMDSPPFAGGAGVVEKSIPTGEAPNEDQNNPGPLYDKIIRAGVDGIRARYYMGVRIL